MKFKPRKSRFPKWLCHDITFEKFKWLDTMPLPPNILIFYFNHIHLDCFIDFLGYQVLCCKRM